MERYNTRSSLFSCSDNVDYKKIINYDSREKINVHEDYSPIRNRRITEAILGKFVKHDVKVIDTLVKK